MNRQRHRIKVLLAPLVGLQRLSRTSGPLHSFWSIQPNSFPVVFGLNLQRPIATLRTGTLWLTRWPFRWANRRDSFPELCFGRRTLWLEDMRVIARFGKPFRLHHIYPRHLHSRPGETTGTFASSRARAVRLSLSDVVATGLAIVSVRVFLCADVSSDRGDKSIPQMGASGNSFRFCALAATQATGVGARASQAASYTSV